MSVHGHFVYHTKANKPNQLITAGHNCFNEYVSKKLKEWLMDIETAADLTNKN